MVEYHHTMTILKHRQKILPDGSLGYPEMIAGFTKVLNGPNNKGPKKKVALSSQIQEAETI